MENISALKVLFWIQWLLNVVWNYVFFNQQLVLWGLIEIIGLFIVVCSIFYIGLRWMGFRAFWLLPYIFWLMIAISLNAFIVFRN